MEQKVSPRARFFSPDPRLALVFMGLMVTLVWKVHPAVLVIYGVCLGGLVWYLWPHARMDSRMIVRSVLFALFWAVMKLAEGVVPFLWQQAGVLSFAEGVHHTLAAGGPVLGAALENAGLFFVRLLLVLGIALVFTCSLSARQIGLGLVWFLRPFSPRHAWKVALAFALMVQQLPYLHHVLGQLRFTMRLRGLPASGVRYWTMALPQMLSLFSRRAWTQAIALASRRVDSPDVWRIRSQPGIKECLAFIGAALAVTGLFFLGR